MYWWCCTWSHSGVNWKSHKHSAIFTLLFTFLFSFLFFSKINVFQTIAAWMKKKSLSKHYLQSPKHLSSPHWPFGNPCHFETALTVMQWIPLFWQWAAWLVILSILIKQKIQPNTLNHTFPTRGEEYPINFQDEQFSSKSCLLPFCTVF